MGRFVALGGAVLTLIGVAGWMLFKPSTGYRYEPEKAVYSKFSGQLALQHVEKLVAFGPRPAGSESLEASRKYLEEQLIALGWSTQRQIFQDQTPIGEITFINLRARYRGDDEPSDLWQRPTPILIGSHYDTKLYRDFEFVGANDAGSSSGALVEIARVTALRPPLAQSIELVFFDGEEAFDPNITPTDGLYGSRFYAKQMRKLPDNQRPTWGIILDMIGDTNLNVGVPNDSPFELYQALTKAAKDLGFEKHFSMAGTIIIDDHVPLNQSGLPTIDIIDLDFPPWHTAGDTLDTISAESLQISGRTTLLMVEKYLLGKQE